MTPEFTIASFEDNTNANTPHYKVTGKISDDDFVFCPCVSSQEFLRDIEKNKIPFAINIDNKLTPFDERTSEFATGVKSKIHPSAIVWFDPQLALMREQAKQSILVTSQRMLWHKHRFDYLDIVGLLLNLPILHRNNDMIATKALHEIMQVAIQNNQANLEFSDPELDYHVVTYTKNHLRLNNTKLIIEYDLKRNYFFISVLNNPLNVRIDARIAIARYLHQIGEESRYFDDTRTSMITATAGVYDKNVIIKDHNNRRFVKNNDLILTKTLITNENPASFEGDRTHVFETYFDAWVYAFKYAPDTDIVLGYCSLN